MALVTLDGVGQSASAVNGQSTTYIVTKILTRQPAIPDSLVNSELQDVLRHFYQMSTGWRDVIGPYNVPQGQGGPNNPIQLNPIDQYRQLKYVLNAWLYPSINGAQFPQQLIGSARLLVGPDIAPPSRWFMVRPDQMQLFPLPDKNYGPVLFVYGVLVPVVNTTQLPDISITDHLDIFTSAPNSYITVDDVCLSLTGCFTGDPNNGDTVAASASVPEPGSLAIFGAAIFGLGAFRRWRKGTM